MQRVKEKETSFKDAEKEASAVLVVICSLFYISY
jgi:hypothetical protein